MRPGAIETPLTKIVVDDAMRRQIMREHAPGNTPANHVENSVENLAFGISRGSAAGFGLRKQGLKNLPLLIIEVGGIGFSGFIGTDLSLFYKRSNTCRNSSSGQISFSCPKAVRGSADVLSR